MQRRFLTHFSKLQSSQPYWISNQCVTSSCSGSPKMAPVASAVWVFWLSLIVLSRLALCKPSSQISFSSFLGTLFSSVSSALSLPISFTHTVTPDPPSLTRRPWAGAAHSPVLHVASCSSHMAQPTADPSTPVPCLPSSPVSLPPPALTLLLFLSPHLCPSL